LQLRRAIGGTAIDIVVVVVVGTVATIVGPVVIHATRIDIERGDQPSRPTGKVVQIKPRNFGRELNALVARQEPLGFDINHGHAVPAGRRIDLVVRWRRPPRHRRFRRDRVGNHNERADPVYK
jgi:hypothetical protein